MIKINRAKSKEDKSLPEISELQQAVLEIRTDGENIEWQERVVLPPIEPVNLLEERIRPVEEVNKPEEEVISPVEKENIAAFEENIAEKTKTAEEVIAPAEETDGPTGQSRWSIGFGNLLKSGLGTKRQAQQEQTHEPLPEPDEKPTIGWVSPSYTRSRSVTLDPAVLNANRCILNRVPDSVEVDAYRVLRTKILQMCKEKGGNTIMITSAVPGEGKTLNAINLAITLAKEFLQTVLLVDCDLRRQSIHRYLGYKSEKGLIDYLLNDAPISDLITWPGVEKLTVISGGRPICGSCELLGSQRMKELVADMKSRYPDRYVIFDVPPLLAGADALTFAPLVDHVVVVVREGETSTPNIKKALHMLPKEKVLGLVLNRQQSQSNIIEYSARRSFAD